MIAGLVWALSAALLTLAVGTGLTIWLLRHQRRRMRLRLRQSLGIPAGRRQADIRGMGGWLAWLGILWMERLGKTQEDELLTLLARADWRRHQDYAMFLGLRMLLPPALMLLVTLLWIWGQRGLEPSLALWLFAAFVLGWLGPVWGLRLLARAWQRRIRNEVQMLAQLLKVLFDAGLGIDQALLTVATENKEIIPAIAVRLRSAMRQIERGGDRGEVLRDMARVLDVQDLTDLVEMIRQVDRYGGNVREPLREFVELLDDRRRTELHERVGKLAGTMTIVMVLFLFPALLVFLAGPGFIAIWRMLTAFR